MEDNPMKSYQVYYISDLPTRTSEQPILTRLCELSDKERYAMAMDFPRNGIASIVVEGLSPRQLLQQLDALFENIFLADEAFSLSNVNENLVFVAPTRGGTD